MNEQEELIAHVRSLFTKYLEEKGLRKTSERFAILEEIYHIGHFDSQRLYENMIDRKYRVSRATVYNTLDLLLECGLVVKHQFGSSMAIYEKAYHYRQHDHLVCLNCQHIFEFCDPRIQNTKDLIEQVYPIKIAHHSMTMYGHCTAKDCPHRKQSSAEGLCA
ncbi:MAG: transcriptional repressor [Bacteroidia bacterium]|nr:transcriptional repressor [Bacteroidia bacterium]